MEINERIGALVYKKRCAACFFIPVDRGEPSLETLAGRAGIQEFWMEYLPRGPYPPRLEAGGEWVGITTELCLERRPCHYLFEIQFFIYDLYHLLRWDDPRELPLEEEPYYPLVLAFRDACMALDPQMAILTATLGQDHRWVREVIEEKLRDHDPDALVCEFGLIYLNDGLYWWWENRDDPTHERVPTERGALLFRGKGRDRWI